MPKLNGILETALYTDDMERARAFYEDVLELKSIFTDSRLRAYSIAERDVLLIFRRGGSVKDVTLPSGVIPGHDGAGPLHIAFSIAREALEDWERHLQARGVAIEGRVDWKRGGRSVYFRDPDGHLLELATPGLWTIY